ncbi:MAG: PAS domain-containing protein, partial [Candidatus Dadabacteria bacterium]
MPVMLNRKPDAVLEAFDALCLPAFVIDLDGKIVSKNTSALDAFRSPEADLVGRSISGFVSFGAAMSDQSGRFDETDSSGAHFETSCKRQNGETFTARVSVIPAGVDHRIVVVQDITHEKKLQQRASQRAKELSVFNTFARILGRYTDTNRILQETVHMLLYLMDAENGWIYLKDDVSGDLHLAAHRGFPEALLTDMVRLRPGECLSGKVLTSGRPLVVKSAAEDPRVLHENPGIESLVSVP